MKDNLSTMLKDFSNTYPPKFWERWNKRNQSENIFTSASNKTDILSAL